MKLNVASAVCAFLAATGISAVAAAQDAAPPAPSPNPAPAAPLESTPANPADRPAGLVALESDDVTVRLRPILQADARTFIQGGTNVFLARRIRPAVEATFFEIFDLRVTPEFAGTVTAVDAYGNIRFHEALQLRFGKMKAPVGLERLQSDSDLNFTERALPSQLLPDRDIGAMIHGDVLKGAIAYAGGIFDGALDNQQVDTDTDDKKDLEGRIFLKPFATTKAKPIEGLGLGIAGTRGQHSGALTTYKTAGQLTFFQFTPDVIAAGTERRVVPQASYYFGPFGIFAEYAWIAESVRSTTTQGWGTVKAHGWDVTASFVVTGERATYTTLKPNHVFSPKKHTFGAVELDVRFSQLKIDDLAFDYGFVDANKSARKATEIGAGVQWHLAPAIKIVVDYFHTKFDQGAKKADRLTESLVISRIQIAY